MEADIRPFRGMLLGLFFVTTGASMDVSLLLHEWNIVLSLLLGLLAVKIGIIGGLAPFFGLSKCAPCPRPAGLGGTVGSVRHGGVLGAIWRCKTLGTNKSPTIQFAHLTRTQPCGHALYVGCLIPIG